MEWLGQAWFRVLSHYFSIQWNWREHIDWLSNVLSPFAVDRDPVEERSPATPGIPPIYSLVDHGDREGDRYELLYPGGSLIHSSRQSTVLEYLLWHISSEACRRTGDFLLVHAGAVVSPAGTAVLLPAPSRSGKTTLVAALVAAGFDYLSDEAAAIDPVTRMVHPFPKALSLKEGTLDLLPNLLHVARDGKVARERHILADEIRAGSRGGPSRVSAVVAIKRGTQTALSPIGAATAAKLMAENALNMRIYRARGLQLIADVVGGAERYSLTIGEIDEAVEAISALSR